MSRGGGARAGGLDSPDIRQTTLSPRRPSQHTHTHPESSLAYSPPTMAAKCLNLSLCRARSPIFPYPMPLFLPPPGGGVIRPLYHRRSLSLGTTTTEATFILVVVIVFSLYLVVMLIVVFVLSVIPSRRCCRCHRRTTNAQWPCHYHGHLHCRYHRNCIRCSYYHRPCLAAAFPGGLPSPLSYTLANDYLYSPLYLLNV